MRLPLLRLFTLNRGSSILQPTGFSGWQLRGFVQPMFNVGANRIPRIKGARSLCARGLLLCMPQGILRSKFSPTRNHLLFNGPPTSFPVRNSRLFICNLRYLMLKQPSTKNCLISRVRVFKEWSKDVLFDRELFVVVNCENGFFF